MPNNFISYANILGQQAPSSSLSNVNYLQKSRAGDMDAIFDMSRYYFNYEYQSECLNAALYYKSLFVKIFLKETMLNPIVVR